MLGDGVSFSVMVGMGETFLPAFVLAVGLGELSSGLITSVPLLAGAILQLIAPSIVRRIGSSRRFVVMCAMVQGASLFPLAVAAWWGGLSRPAVFCIAAIYWGFGMATGPAWNGWAEALVPKPLRARYFARRTRYTQLGVLIGFVAGGLTLQAAGKEHRLLAFALLFFVAGTCRLISAAFLFSQSEIPTTKSEHRRVHVRDLISRFRNGGSERLLIYLVAVQFSVYVAGPYFNPYMLGQLKFSYGTYMWLVAIAFVGKMIALPLLGAMAHRFGAMRLLWLGGLGIVPLSGLWLISNSVPYLTCLQFVGGFPWAAYELAMFLLFFETIRREERTSILTIYNAANSFAMVAGSLCSAVVLRSFGEQKSVYLAIFLASSICRLATLPLLARIRARAIAVTPVGVRTVAMRPSSGSIDQPILSSIPEEPEEEPSEAHENS